MLTSDLVRVRVREGRLKAVEIRGATREFALEYASRVLATSLNHEGARRVDYEQALGRIAVSAPQRKLALGLQKMVADGCEFSSSDATRAVDVRRALFETSSDVWGMLASAEDFDGGLVLQRVACEMGAPAESLTEEMFGDTRDAQRLVRGCGFTAEQILERYEFSQVQAVLLRAVKVVAEVSGKDVGAVRNLFRTLKFRRLLFLIQELENGKFRVEIEGPMGMFTASQKYGLELALVYPAIAACADWSMTAEVRWGKDRAPVTFEVAGRGGRSSDQEASVRDEVSRLMEDLESRLPKGWSVGPGSGVLNLPGVGLCVPDLMLVDDKKRKVQMEVLGYWSRDAVWKRVELVQAGLKDPVLFLYSQKLRVSQDVLPDDLPGALMPYKGVISAKVVLERAKELLNR